MLSELFFGKKPYKINLLKNSYENIQQLSPFFDLLLKVKNIESIPLLHGFALFGCQNGIVRNRINRRYLRLCRVQEELSQLDFKKAAPGLSPEDFIFSEIDFSRYKKINETYFNELFLEGLEDFSEAFFKRFFGLCKAEVLSLIKSGYKKSIGCFNLLLENPTILSIVRTLEISLEELPLFTLAEIRSEMEKTDLTKAPDPELLFKLLVLSLDGLLVRHEDGAETKLFISGNYELSGTFYPGNKAWTKILIPKAQ